MIERPTRRELKAANDHGPNLPTSVLTNYEYLTCAIVGNLVENLLPAGYSKPKMPLRNVIRATNSPIALEQLDAALIELPAFSKIVERFLNKLLAPNETQKRRTSKRLKQPEPANFSSEICVKSVFSEALYDALGSASPNDMHPKDWEKWEFDFIAAPPASTIRHQIVGMRSDIVALARLQDDIFSATIDDLRERAGEKIRILHENEKQFKKGDVVDFPEPKPSPGK